MSSDGLESQNVRMTVCQRIADDTPNQQIDLDRLERSSLSLDDSFVIAAVMRTGIPHKAVDSFIHEVRERVWVARILSGDAWPVLLICGAEHVDAVQVLFHRLDVPTEIVHRDYSPDNTSIGRSPG